MSATSSRLVESEIEALWPRARWAGTRLLIAISGGGDSVALLCAFRALLELQPNRLDKQIHAAHFNHGWRGEESDADEAFVRELCLRLGVPLVVGRAERNAYPRTVVAANSDSLKTLSLSAAKTEEGARNARYDFLKSSAHQCGARYVLTAHTASDRVETMLLNLFRGTGLSGVVGPTLVRDLGPELVLVRPMLGVWREQVEAYLKAIGETFREDSSNLDVKFQRNYVRQSLLPQLRERFGEQLDLRLQAFSQLAEEAVDGIRQQATAYLEKAETLRRRMAGGESSKLGSARKAAYLPSEKSLPTPWPVVHHALVRVWQGQGWPLQAMSRERWNSLRQLMGEPISSEPLNLPGGLIARRSGDWMIVSGESQASLICQSD